MPKPTSAGRRLGIAFLFWTAVGLVFALPRLANHEGGSPLSSTLLLLLLSSFVQWWSWGLLAPLIVAVDRQLPFTRGQSGWRVLAHVPLGLATSIASVGLAAVLRALLQLSTWSRVIEPHLFSGALEGTAWSLLVYALIVGAAWAHEYRGRYAAAELTLERVERNYAEARLTTLRMQLDPHFLFNALNAISAQVQSEPRLARKMIEHLGDLLRLSLQPESRAEVALTQELAFLEHYLAIQRIRFGDKLRVDFKIDAAARSARVPSLFLQPLVENAIRHGLSRRALGGSVSVSAQRVGALLCIQVGDDGSGLPPGWLLERDAGVGLSVTRDRIAGFHPGAAGRFTVDRRPEGGTLVKVSFPFLAASPDA